MKYNFIQLLKRDILSIASICFLVFYTTQVSAQVDSLSKAYPKVLSDSLSKSDLDSLYIDQVQDQLGTKDKVLHAEPLYIDLIRDLGARKGEREWNLGFGMKDNLDFDEYEMLVEYEWAVIDRLGLEVEVPVTIFAPQQGIPRDSVPSDRVESLKFAAQWSFFVSEKLAMTMALGYIHEFEFADLNRFEEEVFHGQLFNPFYVVAKRWGQNWHTLIYTGPQIFSAFGSNKTHFQYEMHSNLHYMIPGTRNFIGVEVNKYFDDSGSDITFRPQMRIGITDNLLLGFLVGLPVSRSNERLSTFARLIWEPGHTITGALKSPQDIGGAARRRRQ